MSSLISYSVEYTPIDGTGTSVLATPPPAYKAGDLLVMGVIGGGTAGAVSATPPSGWTALAGSGKPGVFKKTATASEPATYSVALSGTACAAVFVAAFPAGTVASSVFSASGNDVIAYTPPFPSGVTSDQTVLCVAAAVAAVTDVNGNAGYQNVSLPLTTGWATEVPEFGPALPGNPLGVRPCSIGMFSVEGPRGAAQLTSPQGCNFYATYVVLDITGVNDSLAVTATVDYPQGHPGLALTVAALSGAASVQETFDGGAWLNWYAGGVSQAPQQPITPNASGSLVYGAVTQDFGVTGTPDYTPNAATEFTQNIGEAFNGGNVYGTFRSVDPTTAGEAVTLGGTAPANAFTTASIAEILAAAGSELTETAVVKAIGILPGDFRTTDIAQTAIFRSAPEDGTVLVAMVSANSLFNSVGSDGTSNANVTLSDSSGLTWTLLAAQPYPSYSAVWIAQVGQGGGGSGLPKLETLVDEFAGTELDFSLWGGSFGTINVADGQVGIETDASYDSELVASGTYDATGSHVFAQVVPLAGDTEVWLEIDAPDGNSFTGVQYVDGDLAAYYQVSGGAHTVIGTPVTYDPAAMAWWRIRESDGTVYFAYSADGIDWTEPWSIADPFDLTNVIPLFGSGVDSGSDGTSFMSNFNVTPES